MAPTAKNAAANVKDGKKGEKQGKEEEKNPTVPDTQPTILPLTRSAKDKTEILKLFGEVSKTSGNNGGRFSKDAVYAAIAYAAARWPNVRRASSDITFEGHWSREGFSSREDARTHNAFRKQHFPLGTISKDKMEKIYELFRG